MSKPVIRYAGLLIVALLLGLLLGWSRVGSQFNSSAYDLLLRVYPPPLGPSASIILGIDEHTLNTHGGLLGMRDPLAQALEVISRFKPAAVAIDIVLSEPGNEAENHKLEQALASLPNVVLATHLSSTSMNSTNVAQGAAWEEPLDRFKKHAAALGHVHADPDNDGVNRQVLLAKVGGATRRWAMALEAYRLAAGEAGFRETALGLELGETFVPAPRVRDRSLRIRYANPDSPVNRISVQDVIDHPDAAAIVKNRVLFVGVNVIGGIDRYLMTPYSFGKAMSGVEINANAYETLARGDFLLTIGESTELAVVLASAVLIGLIFWRLTGNAAVGSALLVLITAHGVPVFAFASGYVFPVASLSAVTWFAALTGGAYRYLVVRQQLGQAESQRDRYQRAVHYVTHELRTPLTAIQGSSELISRYQLSEEKRKEKADTIHRESKRLGRMMDAFLSVERLSAGQLQLDFQAVPPANLLTACVERCRTVAARKQIRIDYIPEPVEPLWGDEEFLEYACYNLITNAVKYSPASTIITVRAWHETEKVFISVEDLGYGMDETEIKQIFGKFYRTKKALDSGVDGSGLGLAIVEEIVVRHGGSIEVESRVNHGSRFTLALPSARQQETRRTSQALVTD